jgi:hypothetical protein
MMEKKRPIGITILGIFGICAGCFGLLVFLPMYKHYNIFIYSYAIIWNILMIGIGIGLLKLKKWARLGELITIFIKWVYILSEKIYLFVVKTPASSEQYAYSNPILKDLIGFFWILITVVIVYYLTRPKVKEMFR